MATATKTKKRAASRQGAVGAKGRGKAKGNGDGRTPRTTKGNGRKPHHANGKAKRANGNGHKTNGNGHKAKRNGAGRVDRRVIAEAKAELNGNGHTNGNGNGNGAATVEEARRVAAEIGNALLIATSIETARHSDDVELITGALCEKLGITGHRRDDVLAAARLHDIGKASIPRDVVDKPGPLDPDEWELMRQHTLIGEQILASVQELKEIARMVRHSHERWDGLGYPDGLVGDEIPLGSRIIFCADAFHAMRCDRPYRVGRTAEETLAELRSCAGTQFDPRVVDTLGEVVHELKIVKPRRGKTPRSSRLTALLLVLAFGGSGSAIARTDLLDQAQAAPKAPGNAPTVSNGIPLTCQSEECASIFGATLLEQMRNLGLVDPQNLGLPRALGLTPPGHSSTPPGAGAGPNSGANANGNGSGQGNRGNSTGDESTDEATGEGDPTPGNSGSAPGQIGSPGKSDSAPGHAGSPGNSGNAPGRGNGGSPGNSGNAPGHYGGAPGNSGNAPGHAGGSPGNSGSAPGQSGSPGNSGSAPGQSGSPGNSGSAPGQSDSPGNSGNAPGRTGSPGNSGSAPGQS